MRRTGTFASASASATLAPAPPGRTLSPSTNWAVPGAGSSSTGVRRTSTCTQPMTVAVAAVTRPWRSCLHRARAEPADDVALEDKRDQHRREGGEDPAGRLE